MDQEQSWYTQTLDTVHQLRPAVFGPKDVSPVAVHLSLDVKMLGCRLEVNSVDFSVLLLSVLLPSKRFEEDFAEAHHLFEQQQDFFVDKMISLGYFKDQFLDTFGAVA